MRTPTGIVDLRFRCFSLFAISLKFKPYLACVIWHKREKLCGKLQNTPIMRIGHHCYQKKLSVYIQSPLNYQISREIMEVFPTPLDMHEAPHSYECEIKCSIAHKN